MLVVHVHVHVKREYIDAFSTATLANARESIKEPGVARFDLFQQQDDPDDAGSTVQDFDPLMGVYDNESTTQDEAQIARLKMTSIFSFGAPFSPLSSLLSLAYTMRFPSRMHSIIAWR